MIRRGTYLSEVELCVLLCHNALDLKERSVGASVTFATLMPEYAPFAVESVRETRVRHCAISLFEQGGQRDVILIQVRPSTTSQGYPNPHPPCSRQ